MDMGKLKEGLRPWMQVDTWYTGHPLDDKRFHAALANVFRELGNAIDGFQFAEAMSELVDEYHPKWDAAHKEKKIESYALRAEHIASYLSDIGRT